MASDPAQRFDYSVFGLSVASEIRLPELVEAAAASHPDVWVRRGDPPRQLEGARRFEDHAQAAGDDLLLDLPPGRYLVRAGREIIVAANVGVSEREVRLYLLGSVIGALCHQRGLFLLHANAVEIGGRAVAFAGPSGAGKSTLAGHFTQKGVRVLCDDVCAVSFGVDGAPIAQPGVPRLKLWRDAIEMLGGTTAGYERIADDLDKYSLMTSGSASASAQPLARIYVLDESSASDGLEITALTGRAAFEAIVSNIYRWPMAVLAGRSQIQFENALRLVDHTEVFAVRRQWGFDTFGAQAAAMERHAAQL